MEFFSVIPQKIIKKFFMLTKHYFTVNPLKCQPFSKFSGSDFYRACTVLFAAISPAKNPVENAI